MKSSKHSGTTVRARLKPSTSACSLQAISFWATLSAEPTHGAWRLPITICSSSLRRVHCGPAARVIASTLETMAWLLPVSIGWSMSYFAKSMPIEAAAWTSAASELA